MKTAIIGATGYGGEELVRLLTNHPSVTIHSLHATSMHGEPLANVYPHMGAFGDFRIEPVNVEKIASEVEIVLMATPSGVSTKLTPSLIEKGVKVIDLSGDFRIENREIFKKWYRLDAPERHLASQSVYGLPEWTETDMTKVNIVANPGCYPTAVLLGLAPIVQQGIIDESSIIIDAKTGVSGAGKGLSPATHFSETNDNMKIYKVNEHQHTPEIEQILQKWNDAVGTVTFTTHLVPMTRGIMATMYGTVKERVTTTELIDLYKESYRDDFFVRIRDVGHFPSTKEVYGSNFCDIGITFDERTNRVTVVSVIDNLVKGASGQAVQNMNKMIGIAENTGLDFMPIYP